MPQYGHSLKLQIQIHKKANDCFFFLIAEPTINGNRGDLRYIYFNTTTTISTNVYINICIRNKEY